MRVHLTSQPERNNHTSTRPEPYLRMWMKCGRVHTGEAARIASMSMHRTCSYNVTRHEHTLWFRCEAGADGVQSLSHIIAIPVVFIDPRRERPELYYLSILYYLDCVLAVEWQGLFYRCEQRSVGHLSGETSLNLNSVAQLHVADKSRAKGRGTRVHWF